MSASDINSDDDYESVEQRTIARQFRKELEESGDFDYTVAPDEFDVGGVATVNLEKHTNTVREIEELTIRAVKENNEKPGARKLEFLRVQRANLRINWYIIYYVTFVAKDVASGEEVLYIAELRENIEGDRSVVVFRPKPEKHEKMVSGYAQEATEVTPKTFMDNVPNHYDKSCRTLDIAFRWSSANGIVSDLAPRDAMGNPGKIYAKSYVGKANMDERELKKALLDGPVSAVLRITPAFFRLKKGEIFEGAAENDAYTVHSLLVVGYGASKKGRRYFELSNCWRGWADGGYGKVMRKCSLPRGRSSIFTHVFYPIME
ncbi:hypothetical protein Tsubulata_003691 [Turnera subulata]|uniref:Peptidase C1A papain C-terminal domain-containing protein n=1 Tax=Turnera subulata TaxID=218843 RepID=A0A9Q0GED1_9ROSI|nr:hypothetical protein Tsubulata_003691 [Turnera subulata]